MGPRSLTNQHLFGPSAPSTQVGPHACSSAERGWDLLLFSIGSTAAKQSPPPSKASRSPGLLKRGFFGHPAPPKQDLFRPSAP
eukprot:9187504-Alexandrium_andersonii.AAC.1